MITMIHCVYVYLTTIILKSHTHQTASHSALCSSGPFWAVLPGPHDGTCVPCPGTGQPRSQRALGTVARTTACTAHRSRPRPPRASTTSSTSVSGSAALGAGPAVRPRVSSALPRAPGFRHQQHLKGCIQQFSCVTPLQLHR